MHDVVVKDKGKAPIEQVMEYPPIETTQLVIAHSLDWIREILLEVKGTLLTREWMHEVQSCAVKGLHLKVGQVHYEYLLRIQQDYESIKKKYQCICQQEFLQAAIMDNHLRYQMELLTEQA